MTNPDVSVRSALPAVDAASIWQTLEPTIRAGETLALDRELSRDDALGHWFAPGNQVYLAEQGGTVVGTYFLRANRPGAGSHVASFSYVVSPSATGRGIAQLMCEHALARARELGYLAVLIDFVPSSEERRLKLWQRAGFQIIGRVPSAFKHPSLGLVDALLLHRAV